MDKITVPKFVDFKQANHKISMLTTYDFAMAAVLDEAGIESILVGDSLSMVVQGQPNTISVTLDEMIYHGKIVCRAVKRALVIVDMPFPTYHVGKYKAVENAARILQETGCQAVKLESSEKQAEEIEALTNAGIPVMAHVGLRPQAVMQLGGYKVQRDREQLIQDAKAAENSGAFGVVLECIPSDLAAEITGMLNIPTIGIGAGNQCDGQVLVINDVLGMTSGYVPKFVKQYVDLKESILKAANEYQQEVQNGTFPDDSYTFKK